MVLVVGTVGVEEAVDVVEDGLEVDGLVWGGGG